MGLANFSVSLTIDRGWTPSHGGGKKLNYNMEYNVTVPIKIARLSIDTDAHQI